METPPQENSEKQKTGKKNISIIADKILEYKRYLESVPLDLIPVNKSEEDRDHINQLYTELKSPTTQLLDSKFYSQLVTMNRERDKYFLAEGTTRKERITLLARIMLRVTTPQLVLNQKRVVELSDQTFFGIKSFDLPKKKSSKYQNLNDPIFEIKGQSITQEDINQIKNEIAIKFDQTTWDALKSISKELNHWEADIFSQMIREGEIIIKISAKKEKKIIIKISTNAGKDKNKAAVQSLLHETKRK